MAFHTGNKFLLTDLHSCGSILCMNWMILRLSFSVLAILLGVFFIVYGEIDDSPGGQLLGLVAVIVGIVGVIKSRKKSSV